MYKHTTQTGARSVRTGTSWATLVLGCLLLLPDISAAAEQQLYVQSQQAKLLAEPRADAAVVTTLSRGTAVQVVESNAGWHKVRAAKDEGWVFRYFLADHPPLAPTSLALSEDVDKEHARRRASAVVTAGATRGLSQQERDRASQLGVADYNALSRMERNVLDESEVLNFIKAGIPQ